MLLLALRGALALIPFPVVWRWITRHFPEDGRPPGTPEPVVAERIVWAVKAAGRRLLLQDLQNASFIGKAVCPDGSAQHFSSVHGCPARAGNESRLSYYSKDNGLRDRGKQPAEAAAPFQGRVTTLSTEAVPGHPGSEIIKAAGIPIN